MKVAKAELTHLDVPFTPHTTKHLQYWLPHWHIVQLCKLTMDNGVVGWGETIPNYTWAKVPGDIEERIVGRPAAELLWQDELGAGVQQALFDAVGKNEGVPVYRLLGTKVREWSPISWWNMDMPPADWARQCADAVKAGYMSAKLKARTWYDLHAAIKAIIKVVPPQFRIDFDFNGTLDNASNAVEFLKTLEQYEQVAMIESPIPQGDVIGNRHIRDRISKPVAQHFGSPPIETALREDTTDGFVICAGAYRLLKQATMAENANKPFWLQLVGTGITTTWAAHLGAVCTHAKWPAVTCMNIWKHQLLKKDIELRGGYHCVPERPGLGVDIDLRLVKKLTVDYAWVDLPRHVYRYRRASGECVYFGCTKEQLCNQYPRQALPVAEAGATTDVVADDGSAAFKEIWKAVQGGKTLRRLEKPQARSQTRSRSRSRVPARKRT